MDIIFTPAGVLELLTQIDELSAYDIGITETMDGQLQLQIGSSIYHIQTDNTPKVFVANDVADSVNDINESAYQELVESEGFEQTDKEPVRAGLLSTVVKSLLLGGAIKLIKKLM